MEQSENFKSMENKCLFFSLQRGWFGNSGDLGWTHSRFSLLVNSVDMCYPKLRLFGKTKGSHPLTGYFWHVLMPITEVQTCQNGNGGSFSSSA